MTNTYPRVVFIRHLGWGITLPITVIWQLSHGITLAQVGAIISLALIFQLIIEVPTGLLADHIGRSKVIFIGSLLHVASITVFAQATTFWLFLIAALLQAAGWALISGADEAFIYDSLRQHNLEKTLRKVLSKVSIADESGTWVGLLLSALFIHFYSIHTSLLLAGLLLTISLGVALFTLKEPPKPEGEALPIKPSLGTFAKKHKLFIIFSLAMAFLYESGRLLWQPQLLHLGFQTNQLSILYACLGLFSIAGAHAAGHKRIQSSAQILIWLGLIQVLSLAAFATEQKILSLAGIALFLFIEKIRRVIQSDWINSHVTSSLRATILSMNNLTQSVGGALFAVIIGSAAVQSYTLGFVSLIGINFIGIAGLFVVLFYERSVQATSPAAL